MTAASGKYRLDQRLGGGGMAEVFLGSTVGAEGFSRRVAIKRVLPGYSDNEAFARMFVSEARISSQLVHPNIVSVLDFDRDPEGRLFLVMELVEGKDLDALVQTGLLPFPVLIYVIAEVLRGLGHAHDLPVGNEARGVVHRDISPHNVLLSWTGAVKVSDFGIAKARAASEATASEFIKGKPAYMSPEQANGSPLDGRSDLFAVGIMLWEMLIGRRLFVAEDTRSTLAAVLFGQIPRPRSLRGDVPKDLERVTMKLLERDLPIRYATAEDAVRELLDCADAPRGGQVLVSALAERFPHEAPVRQSSLRNPASIPPSVVPAAQVFPSQPPIDARAETRPAAALSLGGVMNAQTGTLHPEKSSKVWIVGAASIVVGVIVFVIVLAIKGGSPTVAQGPAAGASGTGTASGSMTVADGKGPPDAPPPPADSAAVADAQIADATAVPIDAKKDATPVQVAEKRYGSLHVTAFPIVRVYVDGAQYKDTPLTIPKLLVGPHLVTLKNPDSDPPINVNKRITIVEGKTTELDWKR